jgi:hypothetical protein
MHPHNRQSGQSIVEMAFVAPVLLIVLFGIMEFGYLIYAYSTVSQAARNGAEVAAHLPPYESWIAMAGNPPQDYPGLRGDKCYNGVMQAVESDLTLFDDVDQYVTISYPNGGDTRNLTDRGPIEVAISYPIEGITPLFSLLQLGDGSGRITLAVTQRRSIENLGVDPVSPRGVPCASDMAEWRDINGE